MDTIWVRQLKVVTTIGVHSWERAIRQPLTLDLVLHCNTATAAASGDLSQSINYADLCSIVTDYLTEQHFPLLESAAEAIAALLLQKFSTTWVKVTIGKPNAIANALSAGISIERGRCP